MSHPSRPLPDALADWAFRAFVRVADAGPGLALHDVQALQAWALRLASDQGGGQGEGTANSASGLPAAGERLAQDYPALWARHVARGQPVDDAALARDWHALARTDPALAQTLRAETLALLAACAAPRSVLARWLPAARAATPNGREQALQALTRSLEPTGAHAGADAGPEAVADVDADAPPVAAVAPAQPQDWRLRCVAVVDETHDLRTLVFRRTDGPIPAYAPGQFLTLSLPGTPHGALHRSYTISSSPSRPHTLAITVKRLDGGRASGWLHAHARAGWQVNARGPLGQFSCALNPLQPPPRRLLLLAAGSGITPMMSMLRWLSDTGAPVDVVLVQSVRSLADVAFEAEWQRLAAQAAAPWAWHVVPGSQAPGGRRLDLESLLRRVPDVATRSALVCGPPEYLQAVRGLLAQAGVPPQHVMEEKFAPARPAQTPESTQTVAQGPTGHDTDVQVRFITSGITARAPAGALLLAVAEQHGVALPSACRVGQCGTCWSGLTAGRVRLLDDAPGVEPDAQGLVHGGVGMRVPACLSALVDGAVEVQA